MFKRWLFISLIGLSLLILIAACAQAEEAPESVPSKSETRKIVPTETDTPQSVPTETETLEISPSDGEALIVDRCSECHSADSVFNKDYSRDGWSDEFDKKYHRDVDANPTEKETMIDWLVSRE